MNRILTLFLGICLIQLVVAQEDRKTEIWNQNSVSCNITEKLQLSVTEKMHLNAHDGSIQLKFGDVSLRNKINDWFSAGCGYRLLYIRKPDNWAVEKRPMIWGTLSKEICQLSCSFTNRLEYRFLDQSADHFRHYEKINIDFPPLTPLKLRFYVAEELFTRFNADNFHIVRLYGGLNTVQRKHFRMQLYYVWQKQKNALRHWDTYDIAGVNFNIIPF